MRLLTIFLIINIQLSHIFASPPNPPESSSQAQESREGYNCGKAFFDIEDLKENAKIAEKRVLDGIKDKYPERYSGPPFNKPCLIWPLVQDESLNIRGRVGPYRLILSPNYEVLSVAVLIKNRLQRCQWTTRRVSVKKTHDTSDYHCKKQIFSHQQLLTAAEEACNKLNIASDNIYPATYEGPDFNIRGPYFTYPVFRDGTAKDFGTFTGLYRVVINTNCEVVGALTTLRVVHYENPYTRFQTKLVKCYRLDNGPLPYDFFDNAKVVSEDKVRH